MSSGIYFGSWTDWGSRKSLTDKNKSGVYLISRIEEELLDGPANPFDTRVVYIGETTNGTFEKRWTAFQRAVMTDKGRHPGGKRYKKIYGKDLSFLYVSHIPIELIMKAFLQLEKYSLLDISGHDVKLDLDIELLARLLGEIDNLLIKYMERRLILLYVLHNGHKPICNAE